MPRGQLMKLCRPPISATSSLPAVRCRLRPVQARPGAGLASPLMGGSPLAARLPLSSVRRSCRYRGASSSQRPTWPVLQMVGVAQDDLAPEVLQLLAGQPLD